jgi:hypothetical protein
MKDKPFCLKISFYLGAAYALLGCVFIMANAYAIFSYPLIFFSLIGILSGFRTRLVINGDDFGERMSEKTKKFRNIGNLFFCQLLIFSLAFFFSFKFWRNPDLSEAVFFISLLSTSTGAMILLLEKYNRNLIEKLYFKIFKPEVKTTNNFPREIISL